MHPSGGPYGRMFGVHANTAGRNREETRKKEGSRMVRGRRRETESESETDRDERADGKGGNGRGELERSRERERRVEVGKAKKGEKDGEREKSCYLPHLTQVVIRPRFVST